MNRLWSLKSAASDSFSTSQEMQSHPLATMQSCGNYSYFLPVQYEPNYQYPLVIWLHSNGADQTQMASVLPEISLQNYIGIGIRAPRATDAMGHGFDWLENESGIALTEEAIFNAIEVARSQYSIRRDRVCVVGHREGGTMALRTALRYPTAFAAAISLGGRFPTGCRPFSNLEQARKLPMMITLGSDESAYPTDDLCRDLRTLHAGHLGMNFRQYDVDDALHPRILSDMNHWLMSQITGVDTLQTETMCDTEPVSFSAN